jgi:hypothetical protein
MGLLLDECWWRILRFNWFGHQSMLVVPPPAMGLLVLPVTGHLLSSLDISTSSFIRVLEMKYYMIIIIN